MHNREMEVFYLYFRIKTLPDSRTTKIIIAYIEWEIRFFKRFFVLDRSDDSLVSFLRTRERSVQIPLNKFIYIIYSNI